MKVGITAVAREAGVSEATVSRVVNHRATVAPETRRAVEEAMQRIGYSPRITMSKVVLLLTPNLHDPFFAQLCEQIVSGLTGHGLQAVVGSAPAGGLQEYEYVSGMLNLGVAGVVFISASNTVVGTDTSAHRLLLARGMPFVCINGMFPDVVSPNLATDDHAAAELSVDHLWSLGHRRLGLIAGPRGNRPSDRRAAGFRAALVRRGADPSAVVHHEYSVEGGAAAAPALLALGITALVCASDDIAFGAMRAIRRAGLEVPTDVSVVGFDGAHPLDFVEPPLTSVRQPIERIAGAAVPMLRRLMQGLPVDTPELLFTPELVIRASTREPHLA